MQFPGKRCLAVLVLMTAGTAQAESLRDIYELALENDATLKSQQALYLAALEDEKFARSALLPQVTARYNYDDQETDTNGIGAQFGDDGFEIIDVATNRATQVEGYAVSLNQALFNLPAWFSFQSGKELSKQAEATFSADQQNLIVRVVEAYLLVLRAQDNLKASEARELAFGRQLEQNKQRFDVGLIAITDVYESQAAFDLAQVDRISDENSVAVALELLSVLTGKRHDTLDVLVEDFEVTKPQPEDRSAWVEFALANNFNLKAAQYAEEAARQNAKARKMVHAPTLSGRAQYSDFETDGTLNQNPPTPFALAPDSEQELTAWGLELSVPLYTGGAISADRRRAAQQFNASREQRINLTRQTVSNARSLHMTVNNDVARVAARKQSIRSTRSALDATEAGYDVGTRNIVDVLNAQNTLFIALRDYANSRYDYIVNTLLLKDQAGLLSPEDVIRLDSFLEAPPPPTSSSTSGSK